MSKAAPLRLLVYISMLSLGILALMHPAHAQEGQREVFILDVDGGIDPIVERYISRGIEEAENEDAHLVIIKLNTPGGLLSSTEGIVGKLLNSEVATAVYVFPAGAFAASAGTFITTAANFAVMSEGSSIGAATPVGAGGEDLPETLSDKAKNITVAMAEGISEKRGRNKDLLVETITEARALSATEAVEENVVDFIATDVDDLLAQLDGRTAETSTGTLTMNTEGIVKRDIDVNWAERFFSFVGDPNIIGILLTLGALGILVELLSPGLIIPGVTGAMALIVGLVALGTLPFNWAGIALLSLAAILIFFEIQVPGLGFLGLAGVICFTLGALLLFSVGEPSFPGAPVLKISLWLIGILAAIMALFTLVVVGAVVKSRRLEYTGEMTVLVGTRGKVTSDLTPTGTVHVAGELWSAVSEGEEVIGKGEDVEVVAVDGLVLRVRKP